MRVWILLLLILPVFLAPGGTLASGKSLLENFQAGDRAFNSGDFGKAEEIYNTIIAESKGRGDNGTLLQALENLGAVFLSTFREDDLRKNVEQVKSLKHIVALPNPVAGSSNLLINGGFEDGLSLPWGTGHYETGNFSFGIWWNSMFCRSYAKIDTLISHSGNHSLRITNFSPGQPHVFGTTSQRIRNISPNTLYEIELWARADSLERSAVLIIMDPAWHIRPLTLPEGTYGWKHFKVQVNPGDATFVDFRILLQAKGTVWLDDISFRKLGENEGPGDPVLEADLFAARGEFLKAIDRYKALEKESAGNPGPLNYVRGKLGFAYLALAEYNLAMEYFEKVRTPNNTRILLAIGDIFLNLGQPEKALEHYLPVYKIVSQDQALLSIVSDKIAMAYMRLNKLSEAVSYELEALNIMTHINDPHGRAVNYCHLGQVHLKLNQLVRAREYANSSLQLSRATGDRKLEGDALQLLALLEGSENRPEKALDLLAKTLEIRAKVHDTYGLIYSLYWQGHFFRLKKDWDHALASLKECIAVLEGVRDHSGSIEQGGDTLLRSNEVLYEEIIALLIQLGKSEEALEYLNRSRSDHLRKLFDQQGPLFKTPRAKEAYQATKNILAEREALEKRMREELSKPEKERDPSLIRNMDAEKGKRQQEYRELIRKIFKEQPELAGMISINPKNLKHKQSQLSEDTGIVEYLVGEKRIYVFIVTRNHLAVRMTNYSRTELAKEVLALRAIVVRSQGAARTLAPQFLEKAHKLFTILFEPIRKDLAGIRTIVLIPNGILHYLPFQLLASDEKKPEFLVDHYAVVNLCEESFASATSGALGSGARAYRKILLLGNPDGSLGHAEAEVQKILEVYPDSKIYVREKARKDLIYGMDKTYQALHIASHGVLDSSNIANSYILLAPDPAQKDRGKLTLREVWGLNLEGLDLVALSACQTALGERNPGDEIVSLENAFIFAGAASVIASLWSVDDLATARLMQLFYTNLKTMNKADALRAAQIEVRKAFPNPFFWAPFILIGNWH